MLTTRSAAFAIVVMVLLSPPGMLTSGREGGVREIPSPGNEREGDRLGSGSSEPSLSGHFVENRGQWPDKIRFVASTDFGRVAITGDGLIYDIRRTSRSERMVNQGSEDPYGRGSKPEGRIITASFENGDS